MSTIPQYPPFPERTAISRARRSKERLSILLQQVNNAEEASIVKSKLGKPERNREGNYECVRCGDYYHPSSMFCRSVGICGFCFHYQNGEGVCDKVKEALCVYNTAWRYFHPMHSGWKNFWSLKEKYYDVGLGDEFDRLCSIVKHNLQIVRQYQQIW